MQSVNVEYDYVRVEYTDGDPLERSKLIGYSLAEGVVIPLITGISRSGHSWEEATTGP